MTGAGDPVLLIHAGMTDRRSWRSLSSRLAPDHLVLAYDQRGYGETTYSPEPYSPVADAVAVLDAAGISRAAVVGCSMGGGAAVDLALEHPGRVSRLALIAPSFLRRTAAGDVPGAGPHAGAETGGRGAGR